MGVSTRGFALMIHFVNKVKVGVGRRTEILLSLGEVTNEIVSRKVLGVAEDMVGRDGDRDGRGGGGKIVGFRILCKQACSNERHAGRFVDAVVGYGKDNRNVNVVGEEREVSGGGGGWSEATAAKRSETTTRTTYQIASLQEIPSARRFAPLTTQLLAQLTTFFSLLRSSPNPQLKLVVAGCVAEACERIPWRCDSFVTHEVVQSSVKCTEDVRINALGIKAITGLVVGGELDFDVGVKVVKRNVVGKGWEGFEEVDVRVKRAVAELLGKGMMSCEVDSDEEEEEGKEKEEGEGERELSDVAEEAIGVLMNLAGGEAVDDVRTRAFKSLAEYDPERLKFGDPLGMEGGQDRERRVKILKLLREGIWGERFNKGADAWGKRLVAYEQAKTASLWVGGKLRAGTAAEVMLDEKVGKGRSKKGWAELLGCVKMPFAVGMEITIERVSGEDGLMRGIVEEQKGFRGADKEWNER